MKRHTGAQIAFQPRIRKGAFFEAAWRYGCRNYSVYNRTYISGAFSDPVEEYWHTVEHAALWPVMGERQVEITGPGCDAVRPVLDPSQYFEVRREPMQICAYNGARWWHTFRPHNPAPRRRPLLVVDIRLGPRDLGERRLAQFGNADRCSRCQCLRAASARPEISGGNGGGVRARGPRSALLLADAPAV